MPDSIILSPNKYPGRSGPIRLLVVHDMEVDENNTSAAEAVARAFQNPALQASCNEACDSDSTVTCVYDTDTAWAAPGANRDGLQLELAGYAGQSTSDWLDETSKAILERGAAVIATWCIKFDIPIKHLTPAEILAGEKGIVGHVDVNAAYHKSTHWDPGPGFPWDYFLGRVSVLAGKPTAPVSNPVTPAPPAPTAAPTLEYAMDTLDLRNADHTPVLDRHVDNLQGLLLAAGEGPDGLVGSNGRPDGIGGAKTKAALGDFQVRTNTGDGNGHADYIAGANTWRTLIEF